MRVLSACLQQPGPPLHHALDWIGPQSHRSATVALFSGDLFLGRYAGNYFARPFVPKSANHCQDAGSLGIEPNRVCIHCWHFRRQLVFEDEGHALFECPHNDASRMFFLSEVTDTTRESVNAAGNSETKLLVVLGSHRRPDWAALGRFLAQVRQGRRILKRNFEQKTLEAERLNIERMRLSWLSKGGYVCRHGVFFAAGQGRSCNCMSAQPSAADWRFARFMPELNHELKIITVTPFRVMTFRRLGQLQSEAKAQNYY